MSIVGLVFKWVLVTYVIEAEHSDWIDKAKNSFSYKNDSLFLTFSVKISSQCKMKANSILQSTIFDIDQCLSGVSSTTLGF